MKNYVFKQDVKVKDKPSESTGTLVGAYSAGQAVPVDIEDGGWAHTPTGWVYMYDNSEGNAKLVMEPVNSGDAVTVPPEEAANGGATNPNNPEDKSKSYNNGNDIVTASNYNTGNTAFDTFLKAIGLGGIFGNDGSAGMDLKVSSIRGIFGCPYQFMPEVDPRANFDDNINDKPGVIYLDKIISRIPLLIMVPGEPVFLPDGSDAEKKFFLDLLNGAGTEGSSAGKSMEETLTNKPIKYYGLKPMWDKYYRDYVDPMLSAVATFMNLRDVDYFGTVLHDWMWENNLPNELNAFSAYRGGVAFYLNADSSFSEGFNNSSAPSALLSKLNSLSDIGREINFIMGSRGEGTTMGKIHDMGKEIGASAGETTQKMMPEGLLGSLASGISSTVIQGGKLMFPEIWSDSSYSRDYNINLKLVSPDNDDYSIFLNILVPLVHIISLVAPHNVDVNGYISPFIVRVFYKGVFSCPMGLIQSVSFTKGGEGNWSQSGLPTVVDVSISIKELYSTMSIGQSGTGMEVNTSQMDYLANLCGINIMEPDLRRQFYLWNTLHGPESIIREIKGLDDRLIREATYQFQRIFKL